MARTEVEDRPGSRYIDFLIPGLVGLNLLGAGMWGVGYNLVQMRVQKLLRRIFVTPMRRSEFLAGYLLGRSILVIPEALAILLFGVLLWGVPFRGSYLAAMLAIVIGGWTFTGIGVLCASRARTCRCSSACRRSLQQGLAPSRSLGVCELARARRRVGRRRARRRRRGAARAALLEGAAGGARGASQRSLDARSGGAALRLSPPPSTRRAAPLSRAATRLRSRAERPLCRGRNHVLERPSLQAALRLQESEQRLGRGAWLRGSGIGKSPQPPPRHKARSPNALLVS